VQALESVGSIVDEYRSLLGNVNVEATESLQAVLTHQADWTPRAAEHLLYLAKSYGSFMLRNALALSIALDIEDGEIGF